MQACEQTKGQSVLEHGYSVHAAYIELRDHILHGHKLNTTWRLPEWVTATLMQSLHDEETVKLYQIYHDCGKPYCLEVDEDGRRHFPGHARVSMTTAAAHGFDNKVCHLIGRDMEIHLLKDVGIDEFIASGSKEDAITLLVTALCEIHANAAIFGGIDSISFKQKWKQINKRGSKVCRNLLTT